MINDTCLFSDFSEDPSLAAKGDYYDFTVKKKMRGVLKSPEKEESSRMS